MTAPARPRKLLPLTLTAIGVVYADIGTSPVYTMRECFFGSHSAPATRGNVLGVRADGAKRRARDHVLPAAS